MSNYNTKNYTEQGGDTTVIGGTLDIKSGASVKGLPSAGFAVLANQSASTAATVDDMKTDFNALLTKLKAAGIMAADTASESES